MKKNDVQQNTRLAGLVRRYHTWPALHQQTVAEHTWQVMRLYFEIFGPPSNDMWTFMLWHDVGEIQTGDIPYPVKRSHPNLKQIMDDLEIKALSSMNVELPTSLTHQEHARFKFCDLLDCAEHGQYEARLGNEYMGVVADQRNGLGAIMRSMDVEDRVRAQTYCVQHRILLYGEAA